jgi:hypothetical protein
LVTRSLTAVKMMPASRLLRSAASRSWVTLAPPQLALIEELDDLLKIRSGAVRSGRERPTWLADLVILVGHDGIYAPSVGKLRLLGTPTWLLAVSDRVAGSLRCAACAVDYIGPCCPNYPAA